MMRTALVTGVSRRRGIGFAIARRLLDDGHRVFAHSWSPYDATEPWGADPDGIDGVLALLQSDRLAHLAAGWAPADQDAFVGRHMPRGRWNSPTEAASIVALLLGPDTGAITGRVVDAEDGFRRWTP